MNGAVAAAGGDMAKAALAAGLVDRIGDRTRVRSAAGRSSAARSRQRAGRLQAASSSRSYVADKVDAKPKGPIGVVTIAGMIVDGKAGPGTAGGDTIAKEIEDGVRNKGIKALVVRVDSPGGSVLASERIRQALLDAKANKIPVVVSMGSVAASGGYWVSTPADFIYAEPSTITGSIGVFGVLPSFQGTLQKLGIGADGVKTTPLSGEPDLLKGPRPRPASCIQTGVECDVRAASSASSPQSRHKTPQQVDQIAQGRVWDGGTAHQLGPGRRLRRNERGDRQGGAARRLGNERGVRYLEPPADLPRPADRDAGVETERRQRAPERCVRDARARSRSSSSPRRSPRCARS